MKVGVVEPYGQGGIHYCTVSLCQALTRLNIDVTLITSRKIEVESDYSFTLAKRLGGMDRKIARPLRAFDYLRSVIELYPWLEKQHFDLLHLNESFVPFVDAPAVRRLNKIGYPLVYTVHDPDQDQINRLNRRVSFRKPFLRRIYQSVDRLIALSEASRAVLTSQFGIDAHKISAIPLGNFMFNLDLALSREQARQRLAIHADKKVILFFGSIKETKGLSYLIDAFPMVHRNIPESYLVIAGEPRRGVDPQMYTRKIAEYGLEKQTLVRMDYIPADEISLYVAAADVVALPYLRVYQSAVIQLAYAFGRPVVATDVGGLAEVVEDGKTGYAVPPADSPALAEALTKILLDGDQSRKMGLEAKRLAETKYSWDTIASRTIQLYEQMLSK